MWGVARDDGLGDLTADLSQRGRGGESAFISHGASLRRCRVPTASGMLFFSKSDLQVVLGVPTLGG